MNRNIVLFLGILVLAGIQSCKPEKTNALDKYDRGVMLTGIYDNVVVPLHTAFEQEAGKLDSLALVFDVSPTSVNLTALQQQWVGTQDKWQLCAPLDIGDVKESFIHSKIDQWPTNKAFIENFIAGSNALDEAFIESVGASSKGLPAMEYLIFGADNNIVLASLTTDAGAVRRRSYLKGLTANLKVKATLLKTEWSSYRSVFVSQTGLAIDGSVNLMVNSIIEYEEFIKNDKVGAPAGYKTNGNVQPNSVECALSNTSLAHIVQNLKSLDYLMAGNTSGLAGAGIYSYLDAVDPMADGTKLSAKINTQIDACIAAANNINGPLEEAVVSNHAQVDTLYLELKRLTVLLKVDMSSLLGVTITFSDNDGD
jgi:predicted lipoprotein